MFRTHFCMLEMIYCAVKKINVDKAYKSRLAPFYYVTQNWKSVEGAGVLDQLLVQYVVLSQLAQICSWSRKQLRHSKSAALLRSLFANLSRVGFDCATWQKMNKEKVKYACTESWGWVLRGAAGFILKRLLHNEVCGTFSWEPACVASGSDSTGSH